MERVGIMPINKDSKSSIFFKTVLFTAFFIWMVYLGEDGKVDWGFLLPFSFVVGAIGGIATYVQKKHDSPIDNKYTPIRTQNKSQNMICPYCQNKGTVSVYRDKVKNGISGGKLTGAILTGGLSLLATGLSRKTEVSKAQCSKCGAEWTF